MTVLYRANLFPGGVTGHVGPFLGTVGIQNRDPKVWQQGLEPTEGSGALFSSDPHK